MGAALASLFFLAILATVLSDGHHDGGGPGEGPGGGGGSGRALERAGSGLHDIWPTERPANMPSIESLEVMCGKDHMDVHLKFTQPFDGLVSSKGQYGDPRCVYVPPTTGQSSFSFRIAYARCGTKPDLNGQFYENTVVVQYDKDLLEVWDEAKRLRCEWYNDYEKTASKPPMVIADLDVIQLDFRGDNVDCWMEIQHGKGPWAPAVSGIVPLGSTLTLVVAINDYRGEFDMRVKSCAASDGSGHVIQLSDENGCVLRPKMISRFQKWRAPERDERASVITYAFFHAFKFPDALSVHIKCKVEICRHGCLDHCASGEHLGGLGAGLGGGLESDLQLQYGGDLGSHLERRDPVAPSASGLAASAPPGEQTVPGSGAARHPAMPPVDGDVDPATDLIYDDLVQIGDNENAASASKPIQAPHADMLTGDTIPRPFKESPPSRHSTNRRDQFPHGPRQLDPGAETPLPSEAESGPDPGLVADADAGSGSASRPPRYPRRRRSVVVSDRQSRSADVGVSGLYEVISEADLAFTPDSETRESVIVFQGRIREEVVYGICLPVQGFSLLFVLVAVSAVVAALVAGSLLYRYQIQRETQKLAQQQQHHRRQHQQSKQQQLGVHALASWVGGRFLRARVDVATTGSSGTATTEVDSKTNGAREG